MKASLKALAARFRSAKNTPAQMEAPAAPAPVFEAEADDVEAYSSEMAETIINRLCDQLETTQSQVRALATVNRNLTSELVRANAAITALRKLPKNKYYGARKGK